MKKKLISKSSNKKLTLKQKRLKKLQDKKKDIKTKYWISSGSNNLNLALSGNTKKGYCVGRIVCVAGPYSTGKTLLACEVANVAWYEEYLKKKKKVKILYIERESAFDYDLAEDFGMPIDDIEWIEDLVTVEDLHAKILESLIKYAEYDLVLIIVDSLDAFQDESEIKYLKKKLKVKLKDDDEDDDGKGKGSYGAAKAKYLAQMLRDLSPKLKVSNVLLFIIAQIRDDLKAKYGKSYTLTGGRAKDHAYSHLIMLEEGRLISSQKYKIPQGANVSAYIRKNKLYKPRRKANFDLIYEYGVDNYGSLIDFCCDQKGLEKGKTGWIEWNGKSYYKNDLITFFEKNPDEFEELLNIAQDCWDEMEKEAQLQRPKKWRILDE